MIYLGAYSTACVQNIGAQNWVPDQQNRNMNIQDCRYNTSQCYLDCKKKGTNKFEGADNCYLECKNNTGGYRDGNNEITNGPIEKTVQTVYETRTITENEPTRTMACEKNQNCSNVQLPSADAISEIVKSITSQITLCNNKVDKPDKEEERSISTVVKTECKETSTVTKAPSISISEKTKTVTQTTSLEVAEEKTTKKLKADENKEEEKSCNVPLKSDTCDREENTITLTRFIHDTTTIEKPFTVFREITTTITSEHPIINYKITTVTQNDTITTTKSKVETVTSVVVKTSIKSAYETVSITVEPSISYKTETQISTSRDIETIHDVSTSISTAFSTLISSLISTINNTVVSTQNEVKTAQLIPEKVTEYLLQPTTKKISEDTNIFEKEFLPLLKKLIEKSDSFDKSKESATVTVCDKEKEDNVCEEKHEKETITKVQTETVTKYKKSKPKTITKSKTNVKKKTITVTEGSKQKKGPKTVYNTVYKYNEKDDECIETKNNEKPSKTVTVYAGDKKECPE